jgi:uncharacterized membrane protein
MKRERLEQLLDTENEQLRKLNDIVLKAVQEEKILSQKLYELEDKNPSLSNRVADRVASFGGSWKFILLFTGIMLGWIIINALAGSPSFDPYPFILLNLVLSTIAALQAPIIIMSQNRKEERDRQRAINDYLVNLKSEVEIKNMNEKLDLLIAEQMKTLFEIQREQIKMMNDIHTIVRKKPAGELNGSKADEVY